MIFKNPQITKTLPRYIHTNSTNFSKHHPSPCKLFRQNYTKSIKTSTLIVQSIRNESMPMCLYQTIHISPEACSPKNLKHTTYQNPPCSISNQL